MQLLPSISRKLFLPSKMCHSLFAIAPNGSSLALAFDVEEGSDHSTQSLRTD
jgi:hypothetical protein